METVELRYQAGGISDAELNGMLDRLWSDLQNPDSSIRANALASGIDESQLEALAQVPRSEAIVVDRDESGLGPIGAAILIKIVIPVAGAVAVTLWNKVIVPRIWEEKGDNSLKPKK